jgi:hypothetical protein
MFLKWSSIIVYGVIPDRVKVPAFWAPFPALPPGKGRRMDAQSPGVRSKAHDYG